MFKPFRRTKDASDSRKPGVGLGLALAKDTARSLGGDLKLEFGTLRGGQLPADTSQILTPPRGLHASICFPARAEPSFLFHHIPFPCPAVPQNIPPGKIPSGMLCACLHVTDM